MIYWAIIGEDVRRSRPLLVQELFNPSNGSIRILNEVRMIERFYSFFFNFLINFARSDQSWDDDEK